MRIHLSDFENTAVAKAVPTEGLSGTVVRSIAVQDWGDNLVSVSSGCSARVSRSVLRPDLD
jgi:hypothetical protein